MNDNKIFFSLAKGELQKIFSQRKYKLLLVIVFLFVAAGGLLSAIPGNVLHFTMAHYPFTVLSMINYIFAPIAVFMMISDSFAGEMENNQIKVILTRPISRYKILFSKVLAILAYMSIILLASLIVSSVFSFAASGIASLSLLKVFIAYVINVIPIITIISAATLVAVLTKSSTSCFSLCLLLYFGFILFGLIFSSVSPILFTSYIGISSMVIDTKIPSSFIMGILILAGYACVFFSIGSIKFENREF